LAGYQDLLDDFEENGADLVALSADDEEGARAMQDHVDADFTVAYGVDVDEMEERLGLYVNRGERTHLQPAQLILDEEGRVRFASYSSGKVGRLEAEEALGQVRGMSA
jgi:peroxiredoxin